MECPGEPYKGLLLGDLMAPLGSGSSLFGTNVSEKEGGSRVLGFLI